MKLAILQPYLFPYRPYFELIRAVDVLVIYDDARYIKQGYINRNWILLDGRPHRFTVPVARASSHRRINELELTGGGIDRILKTIRQAYGRSPGFSAAYPLVERAFLSSERNLSRYVEHSIALVKDALGIATPQVRSSALDHAPVLTGQARVIDLCRRLGASVYINPAGGRSLYDPAAFAAAGIELRFWDGHPGLSVIHDLLSGAASSDRAGTGVRPTSP